MVPILYFTDDITELVKRVLCIALSTKLIWGKNISLLCLFVMSIIYIDFEELQNEGIDKFDNKSYYFKGSGVGIGEEELADILGIKVELALIDTEGEG